MLRAGYVYEDGITGEFSEGRTTAFTGLNYGVSFELPLIMELILVSIILTEI
ncbi:MAG: hypothetical protein CM15mP23_04260 [Cryomorphaceae bacterium]|nr:MAG: hypothetical protein CM15mP23_04260 [Cryomorphaceae bacterium]